MTVHTDHRKDRTTDVVTFGCRLNAFESELIRQAADGAHLANTVIVNTCAVTGEATRQARQAIRKLRRDRPQTKIIVTGCAAQVETNRFVAMPEVDHVIGNDEKLRPETYRDAVSTLGRVKVSDIMAARSLTTGTILRLTNRARAFVQIQTGCDHRCTFCIIPFGRGPSRSLPVARVLDQVRQLVDNEYKEVVLTGVDLTSYRADADGKNLGHLVELILNRIPDLPRLRLSSLDSVEVDDALSDLIAGHPRLMPHLHLSLQSGDPMILKRMKRRHEPEQAVDFCEALRERRPELAFTADIIAGFPTETDAMFENTVRHLSACGLAGAHIFPFSPRAGTPAARMPQLEKTVIRKRARILRDIANELAQSHRTRKVGTVDEVLIEQNNKGFARDCTPVEVQPVTGTAVALEQFASGQIISVRLNRTDGQLLKGAPIV